MGQIHWGLSDHIMSLNQNLPSPLLYLWGINEDSIHLTDCSVIAQNVVNTELSSTESCLHEGISYKYYYTSVATSVQNPEGDVLCCSKVEFKQGQIILS